LHRNIFQFRATTPIEFPHFTHHISMRRHLSSPLLKQPGLFTCLLGIFAVSAGLVLPAFAQSSAAPKKAVPAKVTVKKNKTSNAGVADFTKDGFPSDRQTAFC
jgi:hypothetical protein